ncbi:hypothetical protein [Flavobacterium piscis]|uniref:Ribosomal protein RSM22 (Predicted rRNA methylase) n=1 Tax=Flavobacterium piscis TaxID=1114874 RepID=A0ABU1YE40_9FLAO|nr:hypothetical protein [Flavobacterium piscis]MDR7212505.1 ribosomal protein RSM22 (predicted rRNA methylase) [Flavobacterium piscis]
MKNTKIYNSVSHQTGSFHSQICSANDNDLIYRKAYKGDWGDWDDQPEIADSNENHLEMNESEDSTVADRSESDVTYENSYL